VISVHRPGSPLTPEQLRRSRRLMLELLWVCTFSLVGWAVYIGLALPRDYDTRHWDLAWAGFDGLEILAFGATAYFGWRGRQLVIGTAIAAATLLVCDAWFDIALDLGTPAVWGSLASAAFVELPLAFFLVHRVRLLLRLTVLQLFSDADGRQAATMSLGRLPLLIAPARERGPHEPGTPGTPRGPGTPGEADPERDEGRGPGREPGGS
jgi:hypothetical protein